MLEKSHMYGPVPDASFKSRPKPIHITCQPYRCIVFHIYTHFHKNIPAISFTYTHSHDTFQSETFTLFVKSTCVKCYTFQQPASLVKLVYFSTQEKNQM